MPNSRLSYWILGLILITSAGLAAAQAYPTRSVTMIAPRAAGGAGSPHHLYIELLKGMTGVEMTHVPYKGSADAIKDVVAGHIQLVYSDPAPSLPQIRSGNVRALGVTTLAHRDVAPDIPPLHEVGVPDFDATGWFMVSVLPGTPQPIVDRLHAEFHAVMGLPASRSWSSAPGSFRL